jgi:hypothetical protein
VGADDGSILPPLWNGDGFFPAQQHVALHLLDWHWVSCAGTLGWAGQAGWLVIANRKGHALGCRCALLALARTMNALC